MVAFPMDALIAENELIMLSDAVLSEVNVPAVEVSVPISACVELSDPIVPLGLIISFVVMDPFCKVVMMADDDVSASIVPFEAVRVLINAFET